MSKANPIDAMMQTSHCTPVRRCAGPFGEISDMVDPEAGKVVRLSGQDRRRGGRSCGLNQL
jgi:hypothetical protein